MTRNSLNLVAAAVVLAGSAWLAAPTPALASAMAQCTTTVTQPDGTITTIVIEGNVCVSDSHLTKCTCW